MSRNIRFMLRTFAVFVFLALLLSWFVCGWWPIPSICGRTQACLDLARGRYMLLGYGLVNPARTEYALILHQQYGVEFRAVAGCVVAKSTVDYVNAYDAQIRNAVIRRFGRDVFAEAHATSERI